MVTENIENYKEIERLQFDLALEGMRKILDGVTYTDRIEIYIEYLRRIRLIGRGAYA